MGRRVGTQGVRKRKQAIEFRECKMTAEVCKREPASESPRELIKLQIVGFHPVLPIL